MINNNTPLTNKNLSEKFSGSQQENENNDENPESSNSNNTQQQKINIYPHLRHNILDPSKNCNDPLTDQVYYCITCKCSTCEKCSLSEHKKHKIILKNDYLFFKSNLFDEASKKIEQTFNLETKKNNYIKEMEIQASLIHKKIDEVKEKKIQEIKESFENLQKNLNELNECLQSVKNNIENFYNINQKFFNVINNNDRNNTLFLMHYEFMALCHDKTNDLLYVLNNMANEYENYGSNIKNQGKKVLDEIEAILGKPQTKFDDFYWDVKFRIKTYNELINKVQKGIYDIIKKSGDIYDLEEIVHILDSKNKKGIQYIFNQSFFNNNNTNPTSSNLYTTSTINNNFNNSSDRKTPSSKKNKQKEFLKKKSNMKERKISDYSSEKTNKITFNSPKNIKRSISNSSYGGYNSPSNKSITSGSRCNFSFQLRNGHKGFGTNSTIVKRTKLSETIRNNLLKKGLNSYKDIKLDDKIKYKYFTYSVIDLYNRLFLNQARKSFDSNTRIFADYKERNRLLKEYIKPVIGTNEIIIFNPLSDKSKKVKIPLNKKNHGYEKFPHGCRHLYIENKLYICGGVDEMNNPISICLIYNSTTNTIEKIDDMKKPHAYHSMEYLDNYDCFLVIGGEISKNVELFDIFTNKWLRLPDLNVPRANINIYFDAFTSEVYALFGLIGPMSQKYINNSEIIEVLELNDLSSGWCKVDYYKGSSFGLKNEYVTILPFTRTKLLLYGGKSGRDNLKLFGLYLIDRMELIKSDKDIIEKIKLEQKKIKLINGAYNKMNNINV